MQDNLRTRVVTSLARQSENGIGRNFLVQRYLREGDYQITVGTRGRTAGHLGLGLRRTAVQDGGGRSLSVLPRISPTRAGSESSVSSPST